MATGKSNLNNRAKKLYKNKQDGIKNYLIKEILTNAFQSIIISENVKEGRINLNIDFTENDKNLEEFKITVTDNGEGFTETNYTSFDNYDHEHPKKHKLFGTKGTGRLTLIYYANKNLYTSYYQESGKYYKREFEYSPDIDLLFCTPEEINKEEFEQKTELSIKITGVEQLKRIKKTDFEIQSFKDWCGIQFFPHFNTGKVINLNITINNETECISSKDLLAESQDYDNPFFKEDKIKISILKKETNSKSRKHRIYFASAGTVVQKLFEYDLELEYQYYIYLQSKQMDSMVEHTRDKVNFDHFDKDDLKKAIFNILNEYHFKPVVTENQNHNKKQIRDSIQKYPSLGYFIDKKDYNSEINKINTEMIIQNALGERSKTEAKFLIDINSKYKDNKKYYAKDFGLDLEHNKKLTQEEEEKINDRKNLIKSGVYAHIQHRGYILKLMKDYITNVSEDDNQKEKFFQNIFASIENPNLDNNLWIIDDKYTYFEEIYSEYQPSDKDRYDTIMFYGGEKDSQNIFIIEYKRTRRKDADIVPQIKKYYKNIKEGNAKYKNRREISKDSNIYSVGIVDKTAFDLICEENSNSKSPTEDSAVIFFSFKDTTYCLNLYTYEALISIAEKRNKIWQDMLFKETVDM